VALATGPLRRVIAPPTNAPSTPQGELSVGDERVASLCRIVTVGRRPSLYLRLASDAEDFAAWTVVRGSRHSMSDFNRKGQYC